MKCMKLMCASAVLFLGIASFAQEKAADLKNPKPGAKEVGDSILLADSVAPSKLLIEAKLSDAGTLTNSTPIELEASYNEYRSEHLLYEQLPASPIEGDLVFRKYLGNDPDLKDPCMLIMFKMGKSGDSASIGSGAEFIPKTQFTLNTATPNGNVEYFVKFDVQREKKSVAIAYLRCTDDLGKPMLTQGDINKKIQNILGLKGNFKVNLPRIKEKKSDQPTIHQVEKKSDRGVASEKK